MECNKSNEIVTEITFSIKYKADCGQRLCISGSVPELGNWDETLAIDLISEDKETWIGNVSLDGRRKDFSYYYLVKDEQGNILRREWKRMHRLLIKEPFHNIYMDDHWINRPANSPFYSSAYYDVLFAHREHISRTVIREKRGEKLIFQTYAPTVPRGKQLYIVGDTPTLGAWDVKEALKMSYMGKGQWYLSIELKRDELSEDKLSFKHFMADEMHQSIRWEACDNREFSLPSAGAYDAIYAAGLTFEEGNYAPHFAGAVCPLFSMRHPNDFGVGDFASLRHSIDWAKLASLHVLQLLPINDTTFYRDWRDSYPYNAISVNAIHPIYVDLGSLPPLKDKGKQKAFEQEAKRLRKSPTLMYPEVMRLKEQYLRQHFNDCGMLEIKRKPYRTFVQANQSWLIPYAAFCILRDRQPGTWYKDWGHFAVYDEREILSFVEHVDQRNETNYHLYVQYLLHEQLSKACSYAAEQGVLLKGDLPIGVAPHSVEVWVAPHLFNMDRSAGAPPDAFAVDGQNWGFPTYNWERMKEERLSWWSNRFSHMSTYFKAFRIDHILGFFRIWEIPREQRSGLLGHFSPALPETIEHWLEQLPELKSSELLLFPTISVERAKELFGSCLPILTKLNILLPVLGYNEYLRLTHGKQAIWETVELPASLGGEDTRHKIIELCKEVALIEDMSRPKLYHPRIAFEETHLFKSWSESCREHWRALSYEYYYKKHNELWKNTALERIVPLLGSTDMLVCAEDLGMIPATVPEVLNELEILSLDLERMPKSVSVNGWVSPKLLPYNSICTTSTHDMPPLRAWWASLGAERQGQYLAEQLPTRILTTKSPLQDIFTSIISAHIASPAMFVILPIQDWMSIDERLHKQHAEDEQINHPENPHQHWCYRLPIDMIEAQTKYSDWTIRIKQMLQIVNRE